MADDRGFTPGTVVLAFLSGAFLGAAAALLMAPQSGRETRDRIRRYAHDTEEQVRDLAGRASETFDKAVDRGRDFVKEKKSVLTDAIEAGREAMRRERERLGTEK